jgi:hypothetical protein
MASVAAVSACTTLLGIDDVRDGQAPAAAGGAAAAGGGAGVASSGGGATASGQGGTAPTVSVGAGAGGAGAGGNGPVADCGYAGMVIDDGPLAYWRLAELANSTTASDEYALFDGSYAQPIGSVSSLVANCPANGAVSFASSSSQIVVGDVLDFAGATSFTVELWIDTSNDQTPGRLVSKMSALAGWSVQIESNLEITIVRRTASEEVDDRDNLVTGVNHVVGRYGGADGKLCIFVNGVSTSCDTSSEELADTAASLIIGDGGFLGAIDDVAIYDHPLSDARILAHYQAGVAL